MVKLNPSQDVDSRYTIFEILARDCDRAWERLGRPRLAEVPELALAVVCFAPSPALIYG